MRFFWLAFVWELLLLPGLLQAQPVATIDLRNSNLTMQSASLEGKWTLYWHKLLTPSDLPAEGGVLVDFPQKWTTTKIDGAFLPAMGYATYACTVVLPQKSQGLGLNMPDVYSSYRLYINGALLLSNGAPGTSAATTKPYWLGRTLALPDGIDTLHLVLQIANFHHSKGGPYKHLVLGDYQTLKDESKRDSALDLVMSGALLMGGLFFSGFTCLANMTGPCCFFRSTASPTATGPLDHVFTYCTICFHRSDGLQRCASNILHCSFRLVFLPCIHCICTPKT